ncbi:hypothetical protein ACTID9_25355 [Brevibacillus fluminis]|uniref:hypothetical protein n=1 Tax=Brevibacillus fluminis TaxID=511487 RepID=UPI003F89D8E0
MGVIMSSSYEAFFAVDRIHLIERKRYGDLVARYLFSLPPELRPLLPRFPLEKRGESIPVTIPVTQCTDSFYAELRNPHTKSGQEIHKFPSYVKEDNIAYRVALGSANSVGFNFEVNGDYFEERQLLFISLFRQAWELFEFDYGVIKGIVKYSDLVDNYKRKISPDLLFMYGLYENWAIAISPTIIESFGGREHILAIPSHFPGWIVEELPHDGLFIYDPTKPMMETFTPKDVAMRYELMKYVGEQWFDGETILPASRKAMELRELYGERILEHSSLARMKGTIEYENPNYHQDTLHQRQAALAAIPTRLPELIANPVYDEAELHQIEAWAKARNLYNTDPEDMSAYYHPDIDLVGYYYGEWLRKRLGGEWAVDFEDIELPEWQIKLAGETEPFRRRLYPIDEVRIVMLVDPERSLLKEANAMIRTMGEN